MWEQRYGVPAPRRADSGYRVYAQEDVELLRRAVALRGRGLSVPAALERARTLVSATDRPSLYGAIATGEVPVNPLQLRKRSLIAISHAIEDETLARAAAPVVFAAFQHVRHFEAERAPLPAARRAGRRGGGVRGLPARARAGARAGRDPDLPRRGARQRVGGHRRRARLRGLPAGVGAAALARRAAAARERAPVRGAVDARPRDGPPRRAGRRHPHAGRGARAGRADRARRSPTGRSRSRRRRTD